MRRVPPEIIGEILLQTLSDDNSEGPTADVDDIHRGPWCYVRVCRAWRSAISSNLRAVDDMLRRSQCTLEELDVAGYDNTGIVWRILKGQPRLRRLRLNITETTAIACLGSDAQACSGSFTGTSIFRLQA